MRKAILNISELVLRAESGNVTAVHKGALVFESGRIVFAGRQEELASDMLVGAWAVDARGKCVTPGLIDAHTHPVFGGTRANEFAWRAEGQTYEQIAANGGGIRSTVSATRKATDLDLIERSRTSFEWMIRCGTVRCEAKSGYGLTVEDEIRLLRCARSAADSLNLPIHLTALAAHAVPPEFEGDRDGYVRHCATEILPAAKDACAEYADLFVEQNYFTVDCARAIALSARELGLGMRMHVDQLTNGGGAALAAELGAVTADHLEQTDEAGIAALAAAGVIPVLLPMSVFALGKSKYPDARTMLEAGMPLVLASDFNPGSSPSPSLPLTMSIACTQMKMSPAEALSATTMHAAASLGMAADGGSLEPGKRADFVIWDCPSWQEIPYWIGAPLVLQTWIFGKCAYKSAGESV